MTLQQLKYIVKVAEKGSINDASKDLFISQPSLSNAILELEREMRMTIFTRSNRGVTLTKDGEEFLGYARQVLTQADLLEAKFLTRKSVKQRFSVSTQHYTFIANAFVELVKENASDEYEFEFNETTTYQVIENVKTMISELGILYLSNYNETVMRKVLAENDLVFTELFSVKPHIFICRSHPLANRESVDLEDLEDFPCLTYIQRPNSSFYYSEEILSTRSVKKSIRVSDRAAVVNFMIGLDAYTISTGVFPRYLHGDDIIAVPLNVDETIRLGVIRHKDAVLSDLAQKYCEALTHYASV